MSLAEQAPFSVENFGQTYIDTTPRTSGPASLRSIDTTGLVSLHRGMRRVAGDLDLPVDVAVERLKGSSAWRTWTGDPREEHGGKRYLKDSYRNNMSASYAIGPSLFHAVHSLIQIIYLTMRLDDCSITDLEFWTPTFSIL